MRTVLMRGVAAALAGLLLVAACSADTSAPPAPGRGVVTSSTIPSTAVPATSMSAPSAATTSGSGDTAAAAAAAAVREWTQAVAAEDTELAWELMAESSQRSVGSYDLFQRLGTELAEGWGAWSQAEDLTVTVEYDAAGRAFARLHGRVTREGMTEVVDSTMFLVIDPSGVVVSPFEEFGNVAIGLAQDPDTVPLPAKSGAGKRIVYANAAQRVWVVEGDGTVRETYLVSGRRGVPAPGEYQVFSKSELAYAGHDEITMRFMVRFTRSPTSGTPIGFHSIPNRADGTPLQTEEQLGEYHSAGCVRQSLGHASRLYAWADIGTPVIVLP